MAQGRQREYFPPGWQHLPSLRGKHPAIAIGVTVSILLLSVAVMPTAVASSAGTTSSKGNRAERIRSGGASVDFPHEDIHSTGPLTTIGVGNDLSCQVAFQGDSRFEFYGSSEDAADCGTFLSVGGQLYAPDFAHHDYTATQDLGTYTAFTPVSQTRVTGSGTPSDPAFLCRSEEAVGEAEGRRLGRVPASTLWLVGETAPQSPDELRRACYLRLHLRAAEERQGFYSPR